ncbi:MAG: glycosyltransferase [Clostridia bacterium]|nr:glycosyltransferase [Clostridia bacterium]
MISLVLPAYNEEKRISKSLDALVSYMESSFGEGEYEILVVDDGSQDNTRKIVSQREDKNLVLFSYEQNRGKGGAVKYGVEQAKGDIIVFTDADLAYPPESIGMAKELIEKENYDVILGSREVADIGHKYPWYRTIMSRIFSFVVDAILDLNVPDTQCGFKAFKKDAAKKIFEKVTLNGWGFDVELIFLAKKYKKSIGRMSVKLFHENSGSKIRILHDAVSMLREVKAIKKNDSLGLYDL